MLVEASGNGNEATRSPVTGIIAMPIEKCALSPPEDESSIKKTPSHDESYPTVYLQSQHSCPHGRSWADA